MRAVNTCMMLWHTTCPAFCDTEYVGHFSDFLHTFARIYSTKLLNLLGITSFYLILHIFVQFTNFV
ncbi:hypothetical protein AXE77_01680 [Gardnerella vaginalis]|uniref:Uncharacterized protein n=1 Tax=Gardnerella vaginalis TaxID=2702 RepID=A0A3E1J1K7_GARVA|nr:hypothetical protein AXE77_01680 [Gardnerella vaginalis]